MLNWGCLPAYERSGANIIGSVDGADHDKNAFYHTPSGYLAKTVDGALVGRVPSGANVPWVRVINGSICLPTGELVGKTSGDWEHDIPAEPLGMVMGGAMELPNVVQYGAFG